MTKVKFLFAFDGQKDLIKSSVLEINGAVSPDFLNTIINYNDIEFKKLGIVENIERKAFDYIPEEPRIVKCEVFFDLTNNKPPFAVFRVTVLTVMPRPKTFLCHKCGIKRNRDEIDSFSGFGKFKKIVCNRHAKF